MQGRHRSVDKWRTDRAHRLFKCPRSMSKLQELVKKYGKVAIAVHLGVYAATLAGADKSLVLT